jgi:hypothetical protein
MSTETTQEEQAAQEAPARNGREYTPVRIPDVVFHGLGLFRPWDGAGGWPKDSNTYRSGLRHASY